MLPTDIPVVAFRKLLGPRLSGLGYYCPYSLQERKVLELRQDRFLPNPLTLRNLRLSQP